VFPSVLERAPALGWPASLVVLITVAYLVLVAPTRGRRNYRRLVAARNTQATALTDYYRRNVLIKLLWAAPVVMVLLLAPAMRPRHVGLAWPHGPYLEFSARFFADIRATLLVPAVVVKNGPTPEGVDIVAAPQRKPRVGQLPALRSAAPYTTDTDIRQ
jgi:hypothetical protein